MKSKLYFLPLIVGLLFIACEKEKNLEEDLVTAENTEPNVNPEPIGSNVLYFNSFENSEDRETDIPYFASVGLSGDVPGNTGDSSLLVTGGCIIPHLIFDPITFDEDQTIAMKVWGKSTAFGNVYVYVDGATFLDSKHIAVEVSDTLWTEYVSDSTLFVPANAEVKIEFVSGGMLSSSTHYDNLEIISID